jgi:hypothetical protein
MLIVLTAPPWVSSLSTGDKTNQEVGGIKAEVHGTLHFQEGQGFFISVKSREHPDWENRVWLWISENKVLNRQLQGLMDRSVIVKGNLGQLPENVHASVPPLGMYLSPVEQIVAAK